MFLLFESVVVVEVCWRVFFCEWRIAKVGLNAENGKRFFVVPSTWMLGPVDFCNCLCVCYSYMLLLIATIDCKFGCEGALVALLFDNIFRK